MNVPRRRAIVFVLVVASLLTVGSVSSALAALLLSGTSQAIATASTASSTTTTTGGITVASGVIGPSTVDSTYSSYVYCDIGGAIGCINPVDHHVFYDTTTGLYWAFWKYSAGVDPPGLQVYCSTSQNGLAWAPLVSIAEFDGGPLTRGVIFDVYHNGTTGEIDYVTSGQDSTAFTNWGFLWRYGTLSSSGCDSISWNIFESGITIPEETQPPFQIGISHRHGTFWVDVSSSNNVLVYGCTTDCETESNWILSKNTGSGGLAEIAEGSSPNDSFLLTGCWSYSSYLGGACVGHLNMYYTNNGGVSWQGPFPTSGSGYYSISMSMVTIGNTAYIEMSTSDQSYTAPSGKIYFASFTASWLTEEALEVAYSGPIVPVGSLTLYLFYQSGETNGCASQTGCNYDIDFVKTTDGGATWSSPVVLVGPFHAYFNEGPSIDSGSVISGSSGKIALIYTNNDSSVTFVGLNVP